MPTADVLGHRGVLIELLGEGYERRIDSRYYFSQRVRVGLGNRVEVGYSNDFLGQTALHVRAIAGQWKRFTVSVGVDGMRLRQRADAYVISSYELRRLRLHAGVLRNHLWRAMVGADFDLPGGLLGMVDHVSGPGGATWAGLEIPLPLPGLSLYLGVGIPNTRSEGTQHAGGLNYSFEF